MNRTLRVLLLCVLSACFACGAAWAEVKVGFLAKLNITEEEYRDLILQERKTSGWHLLDEEHGNGENFYFYDSLIDMQMAMSRGDINEVVLPRAVAEYVMNTVPGLTVTCVSQIRTNCFAFGFNKDGGAELRDRFNEALRAMESDGTLEGLREKYLGAPGVGEPEPVKIERFDGEKTVRVAVTGDLPPIDFVAPDGTPAGFSTAVLAEVGRRLHVNIELIDIDAGARTAALSSGRVDAVFWYQMFDGSDARFDVPDGVILSEPYYSWNQFLHISANGKPSM